MLRLTLLALALTLGPQCSYAKEATPPSRAESSVLDSLVVFHTNDTHAQLMPYTAKGGPPAGGAAARAALLGRVRGSDRARTLLLDAGDVFQGTPYFTFYRGLPDYALMTRMGYDAGILGNHDLDDGPVAWRRAASEARFPLLSANLYGAAESTWALGDSVSAEDRKGARWIGRAKVPDGARLRYLTQRFTVATLPSGLRVALFGLVTYDATTIVAVKPNAGVAVGDPIAVARRLVPELRRQADVVIAITHLGVEVDRKLAERVAGIDLIVGGHSHTPLQRPILVHNATPNGYDGTVIVQAGSRGLLLGRIALYLKGRTPMRYAASLLPVNPANGEDASVLAYLKPLADSMSVLVDRAVFETTDAVPASGLRDGETPLGNFVADVTRDVGNADVGIVNSGGIRAPLPRGRVTAGDIYSVVPFDNEVAVVMMPGWQLRQLLDFGARRLGKGGFPQVSGVSFTIRGDHATDIKVGGRVLESERVYRVATIDFLIGGGDGYTIFAKAGEPERTGIYLRDGAVDFLQRNPGYEFRKDGRIHWEGSMRGLGGTR
ncbi:MAG TPA: bifunctional UDP-sugar hydrolase/5'-nucleotidase [Candidatus Eisenbacteria bacterium]|nr:bifunctional UDP-sugar hydrolase/5'-nucleotidase [Candidatus Eisenbacteria bacterium]